MADKVKLDPLFCSHHWHEQEEEDHNCGEPGRQMFQCCDCHKFKSGPPSAYETRLRMEGRNAD